MGKILGRERIGHRLLTDIGNSDGTITSHVSEDVDPVFKKVKTLADRKGGDMRFKASIPFTLLEEACKIKALEWGITKKEVVAEVMSNTSQRAENEILRPLTEGTDFKKLQARHH